MHRAMRDKKGSVKGREETDRVRVFVRVRPRSEDEVRRGEPPGVEVIPIRNEIVLVDGRERRFVFDAVLPPAATNRQVYSYAGRPLVDAAFSGFNGTLMAYGQTGTGKTYTMMSRDGVCMQMVHKLFRRLVKDQQHEYKVCMSYLQIYQEKIYDLLNSNHKLEMVLREDPKKGVYVENLTEYVVRSADEVMSLMRSSKKRLIFAETRMNRLSSRSHSVCQITIQRSRGKNTPKNGSKSTSSPSISRQLKSSSPKSADATPPMDKKKDHYSNSDSKIPLRRQHSLPDQKASCIPQPSAGALKRTSPGRFSNSLTSLPDADGGYSKHKKQLLRDPRSRRRCHSDYETEDSDFMESESELSIDPLLRPTGLPDDLYEEGESFADELEKEGDDEEFLDSIRIIDDVVTKGKLNICDLAGSERVKRAQVEGERLSELQHINLSLLELGNTIHALSEGTRTHIPFRNSSLTRLLQDSLGGNCKTSFVMCISPTNADKMETRCTLEFGQRALKIKNAAHVNMEIDHVKLAADLRKRLQALELEMKSQKDVFDKQLMALKTDQRVELSEKDSLYENEKTQAQMQVQQLQTETENLRKLLEDERRQKSLLEQTRNLEMESKLQEERENIGALSELRTELEHLRRELQAEKRRSLALEQRERDILEQSIAGGSHGLSETEDVHKDAGDIELSEGHRTNCQSPEHLAPQFPQIPIDSHHTSTDTLYNVLLAEIMSLQLLYQMQDLADSCGHVTLQSRDSGWADSDEEALGNVGKSLLEKGGLILNSLRNVHAVDTISFASTESLREAFLFPLSPKASKAKSSVRTNNNVSRELHYEGQDPKPYTPVKSASSAFLLEARGLESASTSSMGSFCDHEPLSPRAQRQPSDSGCSSQHSGIELSPVEQKSNLHKEFSRRAAGSNVCVPLAEEDDEVSEPDAATEDKEHFRLLTEKVSTLERDLLKLKEEMDSEIVGFFSTVFLVEVDNNNVQDSSQMRHLMDCVQERLLREIIDQGPGPDKLCLSLPVLEQALNLLLVNKTLMSCILVLQKRKSTSKSRSSLPQVDQEVQTEEEVKLVRRKPRKDAAVLTEPWPWSPGHHQECQTSVERLASLPTRDDRMDSLCSTKTNEDWVQILQEEAASSEMERNPDGASRAGTPVCGSDMNARDDHMANSSDEEEDARGSKKKTKKKFGIFACLAPRMSMRKRKSQKNPPEPQQAERAEKETLIN
ncbi:kinesin heavy chain isoform X2 [Nematostella vectensis]|uniref:kinesin heavy chain isoform X2 n=1 Tax=Nematostella vectensis TaxID=45351 RepID=UPI0020779663|nr:kinesin heavy chain isoform X2 [Nematostella vectensis]